MAGANTETRILDNSHATNYFEELHSLWQSRQLCDLTIKVAEMEFAVHKLILVSCSKYFKNMFTQELFVEKDKKFVELHQVDPIAFQVILEYLYSGYVVLSENTVELVLATADFFSLTSVKSICHEYLLKNVDINNCIARYCMGVKFSLSELECQTKSFIVDKLDKVSKTSNFYKIDKDTLKELLRTTEPNSNGEQMYTAVMDWVKNDFDNRKLFLSELIDLIPTENISYDFYMDSMKNDTTLRQDFKCTSWLLDNVVDKFAKLNIGASLDTKIFIASRSIDKSECFQLQLKTDEHTLRVLSARPNIMNFSAISYKKSVYVTAGSYRNRDLEKSYKYDTDENSWSEISLNFGRHSSGACILNDRLFIVGGYNGRRCFALNSCICYDFNSNQKSMFPDMNENRGVPGTSVYQNSMYVCCGWSESADLSCIERYDPREGLWQNVGKYKFVSGKCSSTVNSDFLYTSKRSDVVVERFDFRNHSSEELAKPVAGLTSANWIISSQGKLLRVHETGFSAYDGYYNQWLDKKLSFNLEFPIIVPWDLT